MNFLFFFIDGLGLGEDDPNKNPFSSARTPNINKLLSGKNLLAKSAPHHSSICSLLSIDAQMGVAGLPQSATSQATLLTGVNFAGNLGYHYGPKPNPEIINYFLTGQLLPPQIPTGIVSTNSKGSIFSHLLHLGISASLLNAYPPTYFQGIDSGKHIHSVIPLAASYAGVNLFNQKDLFLGRALSADFTSQGWRDHLNINDTPILSPLQAGKKLAALASEYHFSMFEFWESDFIGHKQDFSNAFRMIEKIDLVLEGLINNWNFEDDVILITSDHGNMEDLSTRKHTLNQVPALLIGSSAHRRYFSQQVSSIGDIAPFILDLLAE
jgi:2,3-bisphosphoglycerate-independent phosphoglycerate mutase